MIAPTGALRALVVDAITAEAVRALAVGGIRPLLLKGPRLAEWLYPDGDRTYEDTDLLVAPTDHATAVAILEERGFADRYRGVPRRERPEHATTLVRRAARAAPDGVVDLHWTLPRVNGSPDSIWAVMTERAERLRVGGVPVDVPDVTRCAFHVALHAGQHGRSKTKPVEDLRRVLARLDLDDWRNVLDIARRLGAEVALVAGLLTLPEGGEVIDQLRLDRKLPPAVALYAGDRRTKAISLQWILDADGVQARLMRAAIVAVPSPVTMRRQAPLARRGWLGLIAAHVVRWRRMAGDTVPAVCEMLRVRRNG